MQLKPRGSYLPYVSTFKNYAVSVSKGCKNRAMEFEPFAANSPYYPSFNLQSFLFTVLSLKFLASPTTVLQVSLIARCAGRYLWSAGYDDAAHGDTLRLEEKSLWSFMGRCG